MTKEHKKSIEAVIENIKKLRMIEGWTQTDLAKKANVDPSYISRLEKGGRNVTLELLDKIAHAFNVSTHELLISENVDEYTLRDKVLQIESLPPLKQQMIEQMISAFLKEAKL